MTQPHYIDRACQKCGGEIQGWTCQGCGQVFRENDAGVLVFDAMEAVAWRSRSDAWEPSAPWAMWTKNPAHLGNLKGFTLQALAVIPTQPRAHPDTVEIVTEWLAMAKETPRPLHSSLNYVPISPSELDAIAPRHH